MKRIIAILALCVLAGGLLSLVSWRVRKPVKEDARSAGAGEELGVVDVAKVPEKKKAKPLAARNPKLSRAQQLATPAELEALEKMKGPNPNWQEISDALHDEAMKPSAALVAARKRRGDPEPYAPIGLTSAQEREIEQFGTYNGRPIKTRKMTPDESKEALERAMQMHKDFLKSIPGGENSTPFNYRRKGLEPQSSPSDDAVLELNQHLERIEDRERARRTGADKWGTIRVRP